ncbi:MAG: YkgJ family cysteine cluster protein, partial [Candidatus Melainabacteria bacterium]|nr:YkgJ family cysteine cluster protein [Candidatus Melainabacteria bacterium]
TCDYYKCSDCCSHTFPSMTASEWQYLETWMQQNDYPRQEAVERAQAIQAELKQKLEVVDKSDPAYSHRGSENPERHKFTCPFLLDNKCSVYHARPLLCRGFGLSTDNNLSLKTCKYYQNQYRHNASPENERYSYDLRNAQMLAASSDRYHNEGKHLIGTIVAWLSR